MNTGDVEADAFEISLLKIEAAATLLQSAISAFGDSAAIVHVEKAYRLLGFADFGLRRWKLCQAIEAVDPDRRVVL